MSLVAASALLVASCRDAGAPRPPQDQPKATRVLLTDGPFPGDQVARADIHILRILASQVGWSETVNMVAPDRSYDLVALQNGRAIQLGESSLPPGTYDRVYVHVDPSRSSITLRDGTILSRSAIVPWSGWATVTFEAVVDRPFDITDAGGSLVVDFDLARSFRPRSPPNAAAGFVFEPFVRVVVVAATGSLAGKVVDQNGEPVAGATITLSTNDAASTGASSTPATWTTARTEVDGRFRLSFLPADRVYDVTAEGPLTSASGRTARNAVALRRSAEVDLGSLVLPSVELPSPAGTYVARLVAGHDGVLRPPPVLVYYGLTFWSLLADTLTLDATGSGMEVEVTRSSSPSSTPRVFSNTFTLTYERHGRVMRLTYPCRHLGPPCPRPADAVLASDSLTVYWPDSDGIRLGWPRIYERIAP